MAAGPGRAFWRFRINQQTVCRPIAMGGVVKLLARRNANRFPDLNG